MASDIIHAEGVRFAVPSSAPQARNLLSSWPAQVKAGLPTEVLRDRVRL